MILVTKRNNTEDEFDKNKIVAAIESAMRQTEKGVDQELSLKIATSVEKDLAGRKNKKTVEEISDMVEQKLMASNRKDVAKQYILYREYRSKIRNSKKFNLLTDEFISKYKHLPNPMNALGEFVYYRTYSRWIEEEKRRENWWETVRRTVEYNCSLVDGVTKEEAEKLFDNIFNLRQFLSGRTLWVGGTSIANEYGTSNFNCAYCIIDDFSKFKELFYLLMVGAGVGFRVLKSDVKKLPKIRTDIQVANKDYNPVLKHERQESTSINFVNDSIYIIIGDSKEGWTQSLEFFFKVLSEKEYRYIKTIIINYDNVRPKGAKLKRFGGTASGHESLKNMFIKITRVIHSLKSNINDNTAKKLRPINCMDICNIIGENVVVGGVRRTSEVCLIDQDDTECIQAKNNLYFKDEYGVWKENLALSHRRMSNNTIVYFNKPSYEQLKWQVQQMRNSGEPAFMNMEAARKRRGDCEGGNPCMEILLRDRGLCNLTTVNVYAFVDNKSLNKEELFKAQRMSARAAVRITCLDLELHKWDVVQKEDRLLGCSLTGWRDAIDQLQYSKKDEESLYNELKLIAKNEAFRYEDKLGVPHSLLVTTIKPEGTQSTVAGVSNGIHYAHSPYYIRRVRINAHDPLVKVCEELEYPVFPEVGQDIDTCATKVIEFPVYSPSVTTKYDVSAIAQLENYKIAMTHYVDHNASITVTVKPDEWNEVTQWLWDNWDDVVAISFLALEDSFYNLMPYEAIAKEEYESRIKNMKPFRPSLISKYEKEETELDIGASECAGGVCPIR